ncbi:MAG TPA: hypothetical protein VG737_06895 [Cyclobacteriaceae bacterium]|nr:hypothetical protein [Cyclobacteriaceae bacterium]
MKKSLLLLALVALLGNTVLGQKKKGKEQEEKHEYDKFRMEKSNTIPGLKRLAIAQLTVDYKLTTTAKAITQEASSRKIAGARVSAYLEFTDGDMTKEEYQEITDYFYSYFQKKLKAAGIDTVGWAAVTATEFYQKSADDEASGEKESKSSNVWKTSSAHNGKILHHGNVGFAGGKGKRAVEFCKDLDAVMGIFELAVDFADVVVNIEVKTREQIDLYDGWYFPEVTKTTYTWGINPEMRIGNVENGTLPMLAPAKGWGDMIMMWNDIESHAKYADLMTEDMSKARGTVTSLVAFRKELTPVVIQTTRDKYKAAAKKTVEAYADNFVAMCLKYRKEK